MNETYRTSCIKDFHLTSSAIHVDHTLVRRVAQITKGRKTDTLFHEELVRNPVASCRIVVEVEEGQLLTTFLQRWAFGDFVFLTGGQTALFLNFKSTSVHIVCGCFQMEGSCLPRIDAEFFVLHLSQVPTVRTDQITCRRMGLVVSPLNVMFRAEVTNITWLAVLAKIQSGLGLNRVNELYGNDDMKTSARSHRVTQE